MKRGTLFQTALFVVALFGILTACADSEVGAEKGNIAPDFELSGFTLVSRQLPSGEKEYSYEDLEGVKLSDFRGKAVFLNMWGSWCGPCRKEMPQMERMYQVYKNWDFTILAVEVEQREGPDRVKEFVEEYGLTFPILLGGKDVAKLYAIRAYPTTFLIGPEGIIIERLEGLVYRWDSVRGHEIIESLILKEE